MAGYLNKVTLIGNVGRDPEIRSTQSGERIANLSIATSEFWKNKQGEKQERTEWHRITIFNDKLVEIVDKYVKKGSKLYLEGALQTRKWIDNEGKDRYSTEVVLQRFNGTIILLDGRDFASQPERPDPLRPVQPDLDDDIPF